MQFGSMAFFSTHCFSRRFILSFGLLTLGFIASPTFSASFEKQVSTAANWIGKTWPQDIDHRASTDSNIYIAHLQISIANDEALWRSKPSLALGQRLLANYLLRYQLFQHSRDLLSSDRLAKRMKKMLGAKKQASVQFKHLLAKQASMNHRFTEAQALFGQEALPLDLSLLIAHAQGDYSDLKTLPNCLSADVQDSFELSNIAERLLMLGRFKEAIECFQLAEYRYQDVNPFVLSWLQTQVGIAFLEADDIPSANTVFRRAYLRFPSYTLAAEHLAETEFLLGNLAEAESLYLAVTKVSDHPLFIAQLAEVQQKLGKHKAAKLNKELGLQGFNRMLENHLGAFADHGAQYLLEQGMQQRAYEIAQINIRNRQDKDAWLLLGESAEINGDLVQACKAWKKLKSLQESYQLQMRGLDLKDKIKASCNTGLKRA
ncbi:tetratricopeptide repeat protein [uncultured Pseudoteredinibacter sp.]|uniref:tetratricopeptide repeat protein n=1 Tax=uncultured Pseudoteredinibacter sp. TaxID=1641701 RepID=UPI0026243A69|nr:tetratricopeptide repeat protein [uncultured Pseudoteredinibacter sp.]